MYRIQWILIFVLLLTLQPAHAQNRKFDILDGRKKIEIPFSYIHNFILIEVRLFGLLPMQFIFDTGAEHTILFKREFADFLKVQYDLRIPIIGSDMSRELYALVARSVDLELVGLSPMKRDILVLEENYFHLDEITGTQIHGIIGGSFFKNTVIHIDYRKQHLTLYEVGSFESPSGYIKIPIDVRANRPYINAEGTLLDDTQLDLHLLVDTGAGLPLLLHNNTDPQLQLPKHYILGKLGIGLGGYIEGYIGRIKKLQVGEIPFDHVLTSFQDLSSTVDVDSTRLRNGLLGNQILSRFDVYINYVQEAMYLKPRRGYKREFKMDRSGLVLFALGHNLNEYVVQDTIARSPAAQVDIRPGDIIRRIQGFPAKFFTLDHITSILQKREGKKIRIVILRDNELIKKTFRLRDLI